ncbi:MAG: hypothetical protein HYX38_13630 [Rhodospirillales bacterium]|nr:hypothetical protein [Rhodospirillales bacterium]
MRSFTCLLPALLGILAIAASAWAQPATSIAVAADDDCIAVYSGDVERRLLRLHFDRAAAKVAFSLFGPPGIETIAVAPKGAFVVYAAIPTGDFERTPHVFLLDELGRPQGKPVPSPVGAVAALAVSPKGDWIAASSECGWISLFALERAGSSMRLVPRATFGVSADRPYTYALRPDGSLVTMTDDWVMIYRTGDGEIRRVVDLKTLNRTLEPASRDGSGDAKQLIAPARFETWTINGAAAGADNEAIFLAVRDGWIDLFTKEGAFVRRVQTGTAGQGFALVDLVAARATGRKYFERPH